MGYEAAHRISITYGNWIVYWKFLGEYNFGTYRSNMNNILHKDEIEFLLCLSESLIAQSISILVTNKLTEWLTD
jgi:hypothetical protein